MAFNLKKTNFVIILFLLFTSIYAEDTIWSRIFFKDFCDIGGAVIADPIKSGLITAGFGLATYALMKNDLWISKQIKASPNKFKDDFFYVFNNAGDGVYVLAADSILFALGGVKEKKSAEMVVEAMAVSGAISYASKVIFGRQRPSQTDNPLSFKWINLSDNSYPSGHTTTAFAWATIIGDRYDIGWITYPIAALTGVARIYRGAHWPSDVLLGAVIGVITGKVINNAIPEVKVTASATGVDFNYSF